MSLGLDNWKILWSRWVSVSTTSKNLSLVKSRSRDFDIWVSVSVSMTRLTIWSRWSWSRDHKLGLANLWVTTGGHKGKKTLWWVCLVVRTGWISLYVTFLIKYVKFMHSNVGPKITPSLIFSGVVLRTPPPTMRSNRHPLPDRVNLLSR